MADVIFLLVVVAFFGLMVLLVKACEHIIGPDEHVAPPRSRRRATVRRERCGMTADNIVGLVIAVLLTVYLVAALVFPEKF